MKILVLNGSPKGKKSNTMKLTEAFLNGINNANRKVETTVLNLTEFKIEHCLGCFACWAKTPGKCVIKDDMEMLLEKYLEADVIIWSFPLYYFGMPSKIKAFMDRMLPTLLPYIENTNEGSGTHSFRYDMSGKRYVLVSTCGFHSKKNNYEGLLEQFRIIFGEKLVKIISTEGELFRVPQLKKRTDEYLSYVINAGEEFERNGKLSDETINKLDEQLYPTETFIEMANINWKLEEEKGTTPLFETKRKAYMPMKLMTTVYNSKKLKKEGTVFELYFTDIDEKYQLKLFKDRCELHSDNFEEYSTKIETSFELWQQISKGEVDGAQALMEKKYKVYGDFSLMMDFDSFFSTDSESKNDQKSVINESHKKKTNMAFNFIPWIPFWALYGSMAAIVGILLASGINLFSGKFKLTIYDKINMAASSLLGVIILSGVKLSNVSLLTYIALALIWGSSCLSKIPLTTYYSINDYDDSMFNNLMFIKTNRILTFLWSLVYLIMGTVNYIGSNLGVNFIYIHITTLILVIAMLSFTKWFAGWYPAKIARG